MQIDGVYQFLVHLLVPGGDRRYEEPARIARNPNPIFAIFMFSICIMRDVINVNALGQVEIVQYWRQPAVSRGSLSRARA